MPSVSRIVGLALACGAADVGGSLSDAELALAKRATAAPRSAVRLVLEGLRDGADPLGEELLALRPAAERRSQGAFYTRRAIVEPMVAWAIDQQPTRLVDPGCGSGRFSLEALRRDRSLEVLAVDLDPLATIMTRAALAAVRARKARVVHGDYLAVDIPRIEGRTAFVGNPPYVRHHQLNRKTKMRAAALAWSIGYRVSGLAGLHALFYLATLAKHGVAGDVGSFVTSAEWLDVCYGSVVRDAFVNGLGGRSIAVFDRTSIPFDDAMTTAAITTFAIGAKSRLVHVAHVVSASQRRSLRLEKGEHAVQRAVLQRASRWSPFLRGDIEEAAKATLGALFRVSRGQVTGSNSFFVLTREAAHSSGITEFCVPLITSAEEVFESPGVLHDRPERMVGLEIPRDVDLREHHALAAYLRSGERRGVHEGYVARHRRPWFSMVFPRPPIIATYMARQAPIFARNPDSLGLINVAHGLYPRQPLDELSLAQVVGVLNATRASFIGRGRTYHGGLEKFEPREMEALPFNMPATA